MIDLRIGQFRLAYDGVQWTVTRVVIGKEGKSAGQEREADHGYHGRLAHALQDVFDRLAGQGDSESVAALHAAVDTHARAIHAAVAEIDQQLTAARHAGAV